MGYQQVVVRSVPPEARPELADLTTQFLMCLRQSQAERDCTVAVVRSHRWQPFGSAPPYLTRPATGTRCWQYPIMTTVAAQARPPGAGTTTDAHGHLGIDRTLLNARATADPDLVGLSVSGVR